MATVDPTLHEQPPSDDQQIERLGRGGRLSLLAAALSAVVNLALVVTVTRSYTQVVAGLFFSVTSLFLIAQATARAGSATGVVYFVSRYRALSQAGRIRDSLRAALVPVTIGSSALAVVLVVAAPWIAEDVLGTDRDDAVAAIRVLAVVLPFAVVSDVVLAATRGFGPLKPYLGLEKIGRPLMQLALIGLAAALGAGGAALLSAAWGLPYVVTSVAGVCVLVVLLRHATREAADAHGEPHEMRTFWTYTWPRGVAGVVQIVLQRLDVVVVAALLGLTEAAVYGAVTRFLVLGQLGGQALGVVVQPTLGGLLALDRVRESRTVYRTSTMWLVLVTWPIYLAVATLAPWVTDLFGDGYDGGQSVLVVLCLTMLAATACGLVDIVLAMAGKTRWLLGNNIVALTVNVLLLVALVPAFGLVGAALARAAAILVNNLLPLGQLWRHVRLHPFGRGTATAMALAGTSFGIVAPLVASSGDDSAVVGVLGVIAGFVVMAVGCWFLRRPLELESLVSIRRRGSRVGED